LIALFSVAQGHALFAGTCGSFCTAGRSRATESINAFAYNIARSIRPMLA